MMDKIVKYLNQRITGSVYNAPEILNAYSVDRSALKVRPKLVAIPESTEDIQKLLQFFSELAKKDIRVPLAIRGSGLSETGSNLSSGVVISTEKLNRLMEIDTRERLVRVQAGITLKELNTALSINGLTLPIKANKNETIGSLISRAYIDPYAKKYGGILHFVDRAEIILADGSCIQTGRLSKYTVAKKAVEKTREGEIYHKLYKFFKENPEKLQKVQKEHSGLAGYPYFDQVQKKDTFDLLPLFFGAEGTLGIITEVILHVSLLKKSPARFIATFVNFSSAHKFLESISKLNPSELSFCDIHILKEVEKTGKNLFDITKTLENGFAVFAKFDSNTAALNKKISSFKSSLPPSARIIPETPSNRTLFDEFENSLTYYLNNINIGERTPLLTDFYLPNKNLTTFINQISALSEQLDLELPLFGSYATSIYSLRPIFSTEAENFLEKAISFLKEGATIIVQDDGQVSGGSSEGRIKALITNTNLTPEEKDVYSEIKHIFDPDNILNPEAKLGTDIHSTLGHFRTTTPAKIVI